ncbi:MAG: AraC family transcriptional regulator, partial [Myxococcota bacterium]
MARAPGLPLTTSARLVAPVVMYAAERGMALPELLEELSVGPDVLFHADATVPTETLGRAWRTVAAAFPNEPVGLAVAQTIPLSSLGPLVHVAQHSSTRREALDAYLRFLPLLTPALSVSLEDTGQETAFALSHDFDDADGGHATECALLLSARVGAQLAGDTILRVTLPWASHGPVDAYPAAFGAPVRFGARASAVWLSAEALALPPTRPDPFLFEHVTRHLEEVRRRLLVDVGPLQTVMAAITDCANRSEYGHVAIAMNDLQDLFECLDVHGSLEDLDPFEDRDLIARMLADTLASQSTAVWLDKMDHAGLWAAPVMDWHALVNSGILQKLGMVGACQSMTGAAHNPAWSILSSQTAVDCEASVSASMRAM